MPETVVDNVARSKVRSLRAEIEQLLDVPAGATLDVAKLNGTTRARLLSASRHIGLRGVSRLRKAELAVRLHEALAEMDAPAEEAPAKSRKRGVAAPVPTAAPASVPAKHATIPWSYGEDRVRAMAVDPDRLFVYWEVTDDAIDRARERLGSGGESAWLALRVYDTTGRLFDGTNAHSYFDHRVERTDRQWFLTIGRPGSEAFVEIGMKSLEGYFAKIARSGRVTFPRKEPLVHGVVEWLTVRPGRPGDASRFELEHGHGHGHWHGHGTRAHAHSEHEHSQPLQESPTSAPQNGGPQPVSAEFSNGFERVEHRETFAESAFVRSWEAGPFNYSFTGDAPVREYFEGGVHVSTLDGLTHVVYGPWTVVIRGIDAHRAHTVLAQWSMYRSWQVEPGADADIDSDSVEGSFRFVGASERLGASELRLRGSSELLYLGASELRYGGASELLYMGASERLWRGASERLLRGASEHRFPGASESRLGRSGRH